jgi:hypothetical protein
MDGSDEFEDNVVPPTSSVNGLVLLVVWWFTSVVLLFFFEPPSLRGWTTPWGWGDAVAATLMLVGAWHAAGRTRCLPLFFVHGCATALFAVVMIHWPGNNDIAALGSQYGELNWLGAAWFLGIVGTGFLCRFVAKFRHRLIDRSAPCPDRCTECGYLLYGLTEPRCPECGRSFILNQSCGPVIPQSERSSSIVVANPQPADSK